MKKILASQVVMLVSTLVVWAPKIFSVTPPPKAAPSPSLFGRCIRMTSIMRIATITSTTSSKLIKMVMGTANMAKVADLSTRKTGGLTADYAGRENARASLSLLPHLCHPRNPRLNVPETQSAHRHFAMNPDAVHDPKPEHNHERERTTVTDQRQRHASDRQDRNRHPYILENVGKNQRGHSDDQ